MLVVSLSSDMRFVYGLSIVVSDHYYEINVIFIM